MTSVHATGEPVPVELPIERTQPGDPAPELLALREQQPLCRLRYPDGHLGWLVTGYALARELLVDPRFSIRPPRRRPAGNPEAESVYQEVKKDLPEHAGVLISLDPPEHTRIRRALAGYFTVRSVGDHTRATERIVAGRLDAMEEAGSPLDLVTAFALPVSSLAICEILGAPHGDRERFERPSEIIEDPEASGEEKVAAEQEFFAFCRELIDAKRAEPGSDLLSELVSRDELSEAEMVGVAFQLFEAGHQTTTSMLSLSAFLLLSERSRWEALRADPARVGEVVEEHLRFLTIVQMGALTRTALEDVELDGVRIEAGENVTVSLAAANRDPEKFSHPEELDVTRGAKGHVAFGHGRHMCIGQHLARLELKVGLEGLMRRFPTLRLAVSPEEISFRTGENFLYSVNALPVTWDGAR